MTMSRSPSTTVAPHLATLLSALDDLAAVTPTRPLVDAVRQARNCLERTGLEAILLLPSVPAEATRGLMEADKSSWSENQGDGDALVNSYRFRVENARDWTARDAFAVVPWLCIAYVELGQPPEGRLLQAFRESRLVLIRGAGARFEGLSDGAFVVELRESPRRLLEELSKPATLELGRERGRVLLALEVAEVLGSLLTQQGRALRIRRGQVQQRIDRVQPRITARGADPLAQVKGIIRRHLGELEKHIAHRLEEQVAPKVGALSQHVGGAVETMPALELREQARSYAVTIPDSFATNLLAEVRAELQRNGGRDLQAIHDQLLLLQEELERFANAHGTSPLTPELPALPHDSLPRLLAQTLRIERPFSGQIPRLGRLELLIGARRYLMPLMFFSSLLIPLFVAKGSSTHDLPGFAALLVVVWVLGSVHGARADRRERAERLIDETAKARQMLMVEVERAIAAFADGWRSLLSDWLRMFEQRTMGTAEVALREHAARESDTAKEERHRLQLRLQTLETNERRMAAVAKTRDAAVVAVCQAQSVVDLQFSGVLREALAACGLEST